MLVCAPLYFSPIDDHHFARCGMTSSKFGQWQWAKHETVITIVFGKHTLPD